MNLKKKLAWTFMGTPHKGVGGGLDLSGSTAEADKATQTGQNAINSFDPTATAQGQESQTTGNYGTQVGQAQDFANQYSQAVANNPTVTNLYQTGNALYNVPQLSKQATDLTNRVNNVLPSEYGGAKGFDIGQAQVENGAAQASAYLTPQANAATANYNQAANLAGNYVNAGIQQNAQNLLPIQTEAQQVAAAQAQEATGWNQAMQNQFNGLIQKMQSGVQLSASEMQQAQTLAQAEEAYQQNLTTQQAAIQQAQIGQQYQTLSPAQQLVNTMTGQVTPYHTK